MRARSGSTRVGTPRKPPRWLAPRPTLGPPVPATRATSRRRRTVRLRRHLPPVRRQDTSDPLDSGPRRQATRRKMSPLWLARTPRRNWRRTTDPSLGRTDHARRLDRQPSPPREQVPIPDRIALLRVIHHEVVIRWDTHTDDESADVVPDSTLSDTWRSIAAEHLTLRSDAPTLEVSARSWAE